MQQRSADRPEGPAGDATVRITVGEGTPKAPAAADTTAVIKAPDKDATTILVTPPDQTGLIPATDPDATTKLAVADHTVRIQLTPDDSSQTRMLPAPVITTGGGAAADSASAAADARADHRPEFAVVGLVAAVAGLAGLFVPNNTIQLVLLLILTVLGPGAAIQSVANVGSRLVSWALTVVGSLTVVCGFAVVTLWTHIWQPTVTLGVLAGATLIGSATQLVRLTRSGVQLILGRVGPPAETVDNGALMAAIPLITLVSGVALWAVALAGLRPDEVSAYGFSASLGVPFIIGAALLLLGFAVELFGRARPLVLSSVLLVVPVIMQATVPLLDGTIEYAWTYKHIGVVDLIRENGHLLASNDIYQQWPGFFAVVALLSHTSGLDALSFAAWSSLFFTLLNSVLVAALIRQFTRDRRIVALGVLITQICMWVDIAYFSPQAYVFTLMLGFWLIVSRWLIQKPEVGEPKGRIMKIRAWLVRDIPAMPETDSRTRLWAALGATAVFAAIVTMHQLTPFMMLVPVVALAILGILRPKLLAVGLIVVAGAFLAPRLISILDTYNPFGGNPLSNASGNAATWNTAEQQFSATVSRALALSVWFAAFIAMVLTRKNVGRILVPVVIGFLPMGTLVAGNYGGEAIYRIFAFSLPFAGLLIAGIWIGRKARRGVPAMIASGLVLTALMLGGLQGLQGQLIVHQVRATDIEAAEFFYANAERDSGLILVAPNFPTKLASNYGSFNRGHVSVDITLIGDPAFTGTLTAARLPEVENYIRNMNYRTNYLVVNDAMEDYLNYFGTAAKGTIPALESAMRSSENWTVFYQGPGVTIFQLNPPPPPAS